MGLTPGIPLPQQYANAQAVQANIAALPAPVLGPVDLSGGGGPPAIPAPSLMPSAAPNQVLTDQDALTAARNKPAGGAQLHNPFLRGLARTADVIGSVFTPGLATAIPGTSLHHNYLVGQAQQNLENDQATQFKQAQTENLNLQPQLKEQSAALAQEKQDNTEQHQSAVLDQQRQLELARNGQMEVTGPDGQKHIQDDPDSQVFQSRKILGDYHTAQIGLDEANTELKLAGNDPNSPAYKLAWARVQTARQNAAAAGERAQAYMGNYLQHSRNVDLQGNVLPGAPIVTNDEGAPTVVGSTNASQAVRAQANVGQFGDVAGATDNLEQTARALVASGERLNSPAVVYALQNAHGTASQILQSVDKANLTPEERAYVISNLGFHENLQALRKSAGGTVSDTSVDRLEQLAPNGSTPDLPYLLGQTGQIRQTWARLGKGVTTVTGGLTVPKEGGAQGGSGKQTFTDGGTTYHIPANMVSDFKKDHPNAR